jgi:hypothetical protein
MLEPFVPPVAVEPLPDIEPGLLDVPVPATPPAVPPLPAPPPALCASAKEEQVSTIVNASAAIFFMRHCPFRSL